MSNTTDVELAVIDPHKVQLTVDIAIDTSVLSKWSETVQANPGFCPCEPYMYVLPSNSASLHSGVNMATSEPLG